MTNFLILQAGMFLFAVLSSYEENAFTYPFREFKFDLKTKFRLLKIAHISGWLGVGVVLLSIGLVEWNHTGNVLAGVLVSLGCGFVYSLFFDVFFALRLPGKKGPFYLGEVADQDKFWIRILGPHAGKIKAGFCLVAIITINLVYKTL